MKKVLIVTHLRDASPRIPGLAKYLPECGWQPVIMTPPCHKEIWSTELRIIETPYKDILGFWKTLLRARSDEDDLREQVKERFGLTSKDSLIDSVFSIGGAIVNYPDSRKGWKPFAISEGDRLLRAEGIDAMISSSSPVTSHIVARELKNRHKLPWLADLRDLWSQNHNYHYGPLRKLMDRRLEIGTLSTADALVTVSRPWAERLGTLHGGKRVHIITHGFDTEEVNEPPARLTARFSITHTGTVYIRHDPSKLFAALRDLISEGALNPDDVEVRFYGGKTEWLDQEIEQYGLASIVKQYGLLPRNTAIAKQRESQVLLRLKWEGNHESGAYSGKIFEYLAARRPILATGGAEDVVTELLSETAAGISAMTIADIKNALKELYQEYEFRGSVTYKGKEAKIDKYTNREMARKLADVLDGLTQQAR